MKSFKSYLIERAKQIRDSGLMDASSSSEVMNIIKNIPGSVLLGAGMYSIALRGQGNLIVKISHPTAKVPRAYDYTKDYLQEIYEKQLWVSNPHYPRIAFMKTFSETLGDLSYMVIMEHLEFNDFKYNEINRDGFIGAAHFIIYEDEDGWYRDDYNDFFRKYPEFSETHLREVFLLIKTIMARYNFDPTLDLHSGNIGFRKNVPVIVDPLA